MIELIQMNGLGTVRRPNFTVINTPLMLSLSIKDDFNLLRNHLTTEQRKDIEYRVYRSILKWESTPTWQKSIYHSSGTEGGSSKFDTIRSKRITPPKKVQECVYLNNIVEKIFPGSTVYSYGIQDMLLSENFEGTKLFEYRKNSSVEKIAPLDIIQRQVQTANALSLIPRPEGIDYEPHEYRKKILEILDIISQKYDVSGRKKEVFMQLAGHLEELSSFPDWDRHLGNAKYDSEYRIKQMPDWNKASFLVAPCYDAVQIAYQSFNQNNIHILKSQTMKELKDIKLGNMPNNPDLNIVWEYDAAYYTFRQLMYAIKRDNPFLIKKFEKAITSTEFNSWPQGKELQEIVKQYR